MREPTIDDLDGTVGALSAGQYGVLLDGQTVRRVGPVEDRPGQSVLALAGSRTNGRPTEVEANDDTPVMVLTAAEAAARLVRAQR